MNGDICFASSTENWAVKKLGFFGKSRSDAILGLCWLKERNTTKFFSGSSSGKIYCGDIATLDCKQMEYPQFDSLSSIHL